MKLPDRSTECANQKDQTRQEQAQQQQQQESHDIERERQEVVHSRDIANFSQESTTATATIPSVVTNHVVVALEEATATNDALQENRSSSRNNQNSSSTVPKNIVVNTVIVNEESSQRNPEKSRLPLTHKDCVCVEDIAPFHTFRQRRTAREVGSEAESDIRLEVEDYDDDSLNPHDATTSDRDTPGAMRVVGPNAAATCCGTEEHAVSVMNAGPNPTIISLSTLHQQSEDTVIVATLVEEQGIEVAQVVPRKHWLFKNWKSLLVFAIVLIVSTVISVVLSRQTKK